MKLCYIWTEDYKGFKNQGFNLATDYIFNYSKTNSILTRTVNEKHIKNFFGNEITDIVGIIGKNASGKTNILELIQYVVEGANTIIGKPFFVVFNHNNKFIIFNYRISQIQNDFGAELRNYDGKISDVNSIFFSNVFDGRVYNFGKKIINISTNDLMNSRFGENINKNYQKTIQQQIKFIKSQQFRHLEEIESSIDTNEKPKLKPSKVILTAPIWQNIIHRIKLFDEKFKRETNYEINLREFALSFRRKITDNKSANSIKYYTAFLVFVDFILNRDILNQIDGKVIKDKEELHQILKSIFEKTQSDFRIDEIYNYFTREFAVEIDKYFNVFETHKFLVELQERDFGNQSTSEFKEDIGSYANRRVQFTLDYNDRVGFFLTGYLDAITNQSLSYSVEWAGISSGHKAYLNLFANFYSVASKIREDNVLICIDEGDLYFHPKWQTEFLYKLINILPKILQKKCQIFLTTHSPFLVSDLPKSNLIFVQKTSEDNLSIISNENIEGETFGGNIGELYLDAFFMQGSLISRFATDKIQNIIDKIRMQKGQINSDDRTLISKIGDDLIKTQLEKLIDDKN